jgi:hypothetical protein
VVCGAWTRYGFHEDGLMSGLAAWGCAPAGRLQRSSQPARMQPRDPSSTRGPPHGEQALLGIGCGAPPPAAAAWHAFDYPTYFLLLPMRTLRRHAQPQLRRNRFGLLSFHDRDHGDGRADALAWLDELLQAEGVSDATGEVWLHTYPRVLGYVLQAGQLLVLPPQRRQPGGHRRRGQQHLRRTPLLPAGRRRSWPTAASWWRARSSTSRPSARSRALPLPLHAHGRRRTVARIDHDDDQGPLLLTSVSGDLQPLTPQRRATPSSACR